MFFNWTYITHIMPASSLKITKENIFSQRSETQHSSSSTVQNLSTAQAQASINSYLQNATREERKLEANKFRPTRRRNITHIRFSMMDADLNQAKSSVLQCMPIILLLGDSVDRHTVLDHCQAQGVAPGNWSHGLFRYVKDPLHAAAVCRGSRGIIGHLHLFGSNATGPYGANQSWSSSSEDPLVDTKARIAKGIEVFTREVGTPTLILYQSMLWDMFWAEQSPTLSKLPREEQAELFRAMITARLEEIFRIKDPSTAVYTRTTPRSRRYTRTAELFNNVTMEVARNMSSRLGLVEFDAMVWGSSLSFDRQPRLFRDPVHPNKEMTQALAAHLFDVAGGLCAPRSRAPALAEMRQGAATRSRAAVAKVRPGAAAQSSVLLGVAA